MAQPLSSNVRKKMNKILLIFFMLLAVQSVGYSSDATDLLAKVDSYRVCDFRSYPYSSIWERICWEFPVMSTQNVKGDFVAASDYLVEKKYVSEQKKNFPLTTFVSLIAKYDPKKEFPKWRMPPAIKVIVFLYDEKGSFLGSIKIDTNYDAFSINSKENYYFRFGNGAGDKNVSILIEALLK